MTRKRNREKKHRAEEEISQRQRLIHGTWALLIQHHIEANHQGQQGYAHAQQPVGAEVPAGGLLTQQLKREGRGPIVTGQREYLAIEHSDVSKQEHYQGRQRKVAFETLLHL